MLNPFQKKKTKYTGGFATEDMIRAFNLDYSYPENDADSEKNIRLSRHLQIGLGKLPKDNILVCAGSELEHIAVDQILTCAHGSYVVFDRMGEYRKKFSQKFKERGYRILTLDFEHPEKTGHYNPFRYLKTEDDIGAFIQCIDANYQYQEYADPFRHPEVALLKALTHYVLNHKDQKCQTMDSLVAELYAMLPDGRSEEIEALSQEPADQSLSNYEIFYMGTDGMRQSIVQNLVTLLKDLRHYSGDSAGQDTLNLEMIGAEKTVLFVMPGQDSVTSRLMCDLLFTQVLMIAQASAKQAEGGRLQQDLRLIMDNRILCTLWNGKISSETMRRCHEYGMSYLILADRLDAVTHFKMEQGIAFEEIRPLFSVLLYLGGQIQGTQTSRIAAEYISRISAEFTEKQIAEAQIKHIQKHTRTERCFPMIRTLITKEELQSIRPGWCICAIPEKIIIYEESAFCNREKRCGS